MSNLVMVTSNASGAAQAAASGHVVVVVDVIDMSTSIEAAIDAGALAVYGASPDNARPPVKVNPHGIGKAAGEYARSMGTDIVLIAEPRVGDDKERMAGVKLVTAGIEESGAKIGAVLPNLGAETSKLADLSDRVVVAATGTGGVAFDAAVTAGARAVLTGTIARTTAKRGSAPAKAAAARALEFGRRLNTGISVVAASSNSLEDVLAAEYIARLILEEGFTRLK